MSFVTPTDLVTACRVFVALAYPGGAATIPTDKQNYLEISPDGTIDDFLPPSPAASPICVPLSKRPGGLVGYEFRLGSASYPHLKLRIQQIELHGQLVFVYSVDTHDGFDKATQFMNPEEIAKWRTLVDGNRRLKKEIEDALARAGFITPIRLLRIDLTGPGSPTPTTSVAAP